MAHQGDRRRFDGDIAAATHGDPNIRLGQRRGIVNAVANHGYAAALILQFDNRIRFAVRQHTRDHLINTGLAGNRLSGDGVIPGQHHQTIARAVQALQRTHAVGAQWIANGKQRRDLAIHRQQYRGRPLRGMGLQLRIQRPGVDAVFGQQRLVAQQQPTVINVPADPQPAQSTEVIHLRQGGICFLQNRPCQRVAGTLFERGGQAQRFGLVDPARGIDGDYLRFTFGEGSGFIKYQSV